MGPHLPILMHDQTRSIMVMRLTVLDDHDEFEYRDANEDGSDFEPPPKKSNTTARVKWTYVEFVRYNQIVCGFGGKCAKLLLP